MEPEQETLLPKDAEFDQINKLYDECLTYLKNIKEQNDKVEEKVKLNETPRDGSETDDPGYETIKAKEENTNGNPPKIGYKVVNELKSNEGTNIKPEIKSERLRRLSQQLPKIVLTQSNSSLNKKEQVIFKPNNHVVNERKNSVLTKK